MAHLDPFANLSQIWISYATIGFAHFATSSLLQSLTNFNEGRDVIVCSPLATKYFYFRNMFIWVRHFNIRFRRCQWLPMKCPNYTNKRKYSKHTRCVCAHEIWRRRYNWCRYARPMRANRLHTQKSITRQTGSPTPKDQSDAPCMDCE